MVEKLIDGVMHTKESVCERYKGLVYKESHKKVVISTRLGYEFEDLVSEGYIGLLKAFERYDVSKFKIQGSEINKFTSIAVPYISGAINNALRRVNIGAHYPQDIKSLGYRISREELTNETPEEIAKKLSVKLDHVIRANDFLANRFPVFLDKPTFDSEGESSSLLDVLASNSNETRDETLDEVNEFLGQLSSEERAILSGIEMGLTQGRIGESIGFTQIQVSREVKKIRLKILDRFGKGGIIEEKPKVKYLSEQQVAEIKWLLNNTQLTQKEIGRKYNFSRDMVSKINTGRVHSDIKEAKPVGY